MRNVSLEQFYRKINKKIKFIAGYLEDKSVISIIKKCRLKPITIFSGNFDISGIFEPIWIDEFNNILKVKKKKIYLEFKTIDIEQTTTDIYRNETLEFLIARSKSALIGLYHNSNDFILILLGTDNYYRCFSCKNEQITIISPLTLGIKVLRCWVKLPPVNSFRKMNIKSELDNFKNIGWFAVNLPIDKSFKNKIENYKQLKGILFNE